MNGKFGFFDEILVCLRNIREGRRYLKEVFEIKLLNWSLMQG
jgi:hypothetical protein